MASPAAVSGHSCGRSSVSSSRRLHLTVALLLLVNFVPTIGLSVSSGSDRNSLMGPSLQSAFLEAHTEVWLDERDCPTMCNDACQCVVKRANCAAYCDRCLYTGVPCGTRVIKPDVRVSKLKGRIVTPRPLVGAAPSFLESQETVRVHQTHTQQQQQQEQQDRPRIPIRAPPAAPADESKSTKSKNDTTTNSSSSASSSTSPAVPSLPADASQAAAFSPAANSNPASTASGNDARVVKIQKIMDLQSQIIQMLSTRSAPRAPASEPRAAAVEHPEQPSTEPSAADSSSSESSSSTPAALDSAVARNSLLLKRLHDILGGDAALKLGLDLKALTNPASLSSSPSSSLSSPPFSRSPSVPPPSRGIVTAFDDTNSASAASPALAAVATDGTTKVIPVTVPVAIRVNKDGTVTSFIAGNNVNMNGGKNNDDDELLQQQHTQLERIVTNLHDLIDWVKRKKEQHGPDFGSQISHIHQLLDQAVQVARR